MLRQPCQTVLDLILPIIVPRPLLLLQGGLGRPLGPEAAAQAVPLMWTEALSLKTREKFRERPWWLSGESEEFIKEKERTLEM